MRSAHVKQLRRRLKEAADWGIRLERLSFEGIPTLGTADIAFFSPFSVLAGPNGAGKTTLLRALWATLDPTSAALNESTNTKLIAGKATSELTIGSEKKAFEVTLPLKRAATHEEPANNQTRLDEVVHIDTTFETERMRKAFSNADDIDDIINGEGVVSISNDNLEIINYITHRAYRSATLYEVEFAEYTLPFFEVSYRNDRYDSRTMGAGELAAFYLWWAVNRINTGGVLLIEEPETYLSPGSQKALGDFLLSEVVSKKLLCIATSHSAAVISSLPNESIRLLVREPVGVKVVNNAPPAILYEDLGINHALEAIVFVEDEAGSAFVKAILERFDGRLARSIGVLKRNGWGDIISVMDSLGETSSISIKFIGVFDGDVRTQIPQIFKHRYAFLPGTEALESIFRNMVISDPIPLASAIGNANLPAIIVALEGRDHHDWYEEICKQVGLTKAQLFPFLFNIWFKMENNYEQALSTYEAIANLLEREAAS